MEENNNNIIIKGLAIILIAILAINVYRTEMTKKELATLSNTVSQIQSQIDSFEFPVGQPAPVVGTSSSQVKSLEKRVNGLEAKINDLHSSVERLSKSLSQPSASSGTSSNMSSTTSGATEGLERRVNGLESKVNALQSSVDRLSKTSSQPSASTGTSSNKTSVTSSVTGGTGRVSVSAKVKVENRYVNGTTYLPKVTIGPTGVVVVNVTMGRIGTVGSVSINNASTITDEEVLDQCKEAALKTNFAYNPDAPEKTRGTITYTFTAK